MLLYGKEVRFCQKKIKKVLLVLFVCAFKKKVEVDWELLLLKAKTIEERKIVLKF